MTPDPFAHLNINRSTKKALHRLVKRIVAGELRDSDEARSEWRRAIAGIPQSKHPTVRQDFLGLLEGETDQVVQASRAKAPEETARAQRARDALLSAWAEITR